MQLSYHDTYLWLQELTDYTADTVLLYPDKHLVQVVNRIDHKKVELHLPLLFPRIQEEQGILSNGTYSPVARPEPLETYLTRVPSEPPTYLILLMQAGAAALGVVREERWIHHKVIRKYMVRKSQGKAQLTYLQQKGKSRAGSRIRLAESVEFFEEINEKLSTWMVTSDVEYLLYSCPPRLWGYLFRSRVMPPFSMEDPRLHKIPLDVDTPNLDELERVHHFVQQGRKFEIQFLQT